MKTKYLAKLAFTSLTKRKLRSWLTMLGVIIGVASIVVLVSIAAGVNQQISSQLSQFGADVLTITPGSAAATSSGFGSSRRPGGFSAIPHEEDGKPLTESDEKSIKLINGVKYITGVISERTTVSYRTRNSSIQIQGIDPVAYSNMVTLNISSGRFLTSSDLYSAVIGSGIYERIFRENLLNKYIKIDGVSFRVVGQLEPSSGFSQADNSILISKRAAEKMFGGREYSMIYVSVAPEFEVSEIQESIILRLDKNHRVNNETRDFTVRGQEFIQSTISGITDMLTVFLGGIGAISMLVGAIGVANTMFMSVLERTKEIGILKALGMTSRGITTLFLIESAMIGILGGVMGLGLSLLTSTILVAFGVPSVISIDLMIMAIVFSAVVGIVAGVAPARNAAALEPVQALMYE